MLNNLDEWVRYYLQQCNDLQSGYAKTMFRLLRQYRTKGFAYFSKEDFLELLDIPKSCKQPDIDERVIKPILQDLTGILQSSFQSKRNAEKFGENSHSHR